MEDWTQIFHRLEENESVSEKFFQVETRILSILNFTDLFNVLLTEIEKVFGIPWVWLTLIEGSEADRLLPMLETDQGLALRLKRMDGRRFAAVAGPGASPVLADCHLEKFCDLLPEKSRAMAPASLAVVPLFLDGTLIGSLNLGDENPQRFAPDMDARLLQQLGVKVSLCLSNVTAHEKLAHLAYSDALTGLLNRRVMKSVLEREYGRFTRYGHPLSVVFIDLDDFKLVNDTHGHETGDALLRHWAKILTGCTRASDIAARFAGDEFVVILPECDAPAAARFVARVSSEVAARPLRTASAKIPVKFSFGIAAAGEEEHDTPEDILKRADRRLYRAKQEKPGRTRTGRGENRAFPFAPAQRKKKNPDAG